MTERRSRDEGALQTSLIMEAVRRRRDELGWSAEHLATAMSDVAVPWNADIVVNLEHGRRRSLRVHELLALAWVLDVASPVDLLVPERKDPVYPVTPSTLVAASAVRAWCRGETGPLRQALDEPAANEPGDLAELLAALSPRARRDVIMLARSFGTVPVPYPLTGKADDGAD